MLYFKISFIYKEVIPMQGYENNLEAETVPVIEKEMKDKKRYF